MMKTQPEQIEWGRPRPDRRHMQVTCNDSVCVVKKINDRCEHVMEFLRGRWELFHDPLPDGYIFTLPMFRPNQHDLGKYGMISMVTLSDADPEFGLRAVRLHRPENAESEVFDYASNTTGLWAIRDSLLQFLFAEYRNIRPCSSIYHRRGDQFGENVPRNHDARQPKILRDVLSIIETGECFKCFTEGATASSGFVPEI